MLVISTWDDVCNAWDVEGLSKDLLSDVEPRFVEICKQLSSDPVGWRHVQLDAADAGPILIVRKGDSEDCLQKYGLEGWGGPAQRWHPDILYRLDCGYWLLFVVTNNEFVLVVYVEEGAFGPIMDEWLESCLP